jgi:hypothetical protein
MADYTILDFVIPLGVWVLSIALGRLILKYWG